MLKAMGIEKYEPAVVHMLLDVLYGHVSGLLHAARGLADHAGRAEVDLDDLHLAAATQRSQPEPPTRAAVLALARQRNAVPLPLPPDAPACAPAGLPLPPRDARLQPQDGIIIEMPPVADPRATAPEGPWAISEQERKSLEQAELQRRRHVAAANASAAALATAAARNASHATPSVAAQTAPPPAAPEAPASGSASAAAVPETALAAQ
jgi:transcription initiation factor TFIID subunit 9B